jgi:hypothetical protein
LYKNILGPGKSSGRQLEVLRDDRAITFYEFKLMMPFARELFRECLRISDPGDRRVVEELRNQAVLYARLFLPILTPGLENCEADFIRGGKMRKKGRVDPLVDQMERALDLEEADSKMNGRSPEILKRRRACHDKDR